MPVESAADLATFYSTAEFAKVGVYTPPAAGTPVACRVLFDPRDPGAMAGEGRPLAGVATIQVRKSEIATPAVGGSFALTGISGTWTIVERPRVNDTESSEWVCWVAST